MDRTIFCVVPRMKITLVSKWQMDWTIVCIALRIKIIYTFFYKKPADKKLNAANFEAYETHKL